MIKKVFTVYDTAAEMYLQPFYELTVGQASRAFTDACNTDNHSFNLHPADFALFELGTYDDATGQHANHPAPIHIGLAVQYKDQINPDQTKVEKFREAFKEVRKIQGATE